MNDNHSKNPLAWTSALSSPARLKNRMMPVPIASANPDRNDSGHGILFRSRNRTIAIGTMTGATTLAVQICQRTRGRRLKRRLDAAAERALEPADLLIGRPRQQGVRRALLVELFERELEQSETTGLMCGGVPQHLIETRMRVRVLIESQSRRARPCSSPAARDPIVLIATCRFSVWSSARYTAPIPPSPSLRRSRYEPAVAAARWRSISGRLTGTPSPEPGVISVGELRESARDGESGRPCSTTAGDYTIRTADRGLSTGDWGLGTAVDCRPWTVDSVTARSGER